MSKMNVRGKEVDPIECVSALMLGPDFLLCSTSLWVSYSGRVGAKLFSGP